MAHPTFDSLLRAERAAVNQPVSLLSRIVGRSATLMEDGQVGSRLRFTALRSPDLRDSALLTEPALLERAEHAFEHGYPVVLSGRFVPRQRDDRTVLELSLTDIQPVREVSSLLCPDPDEVRRTEERIERFRERVGRGESALLDHVLSEARLLLGLRGNATRQYQRMQTAILLQALSGDTTSEGNSRLSAMVLGEPGRSKKTLALLAQLLSPVAMMAHGASVTPSTLGGQVHRQRDGSLCIEPGMLLRGDGGVVIIEDFHSMRRHRERIQQLLCVTLTEGLVLLCGPNVEERDPIHTDAAVYLDLNLEAALKGVVPGRSNETLLLSRGFATDLLSRIDLLGCIGAGSDSERAARPSLWSEGDRPAPRPVEEDLVQRRRDLQLLLALIRDRIPDVDLEPVLDQVVDGFLERSQRVEWMRSRSVDVPAFLQRSRSGLYKLTAAAARLRLRSSATAEDAALALDLFDLKLEALTWLCQHTFPLRAESGTRPPYRTGDA